MAHNSRSTASMEDEIEQERFPEAASPSPSPPSPPPVFGGSPFGLALLPSRPLPSTLPPPPPPSPSPSPPPESASDLEDGEIEEEPADAGEIASRPASRKAARNKRRRDLIKAKRKARKAQREKKKKTAEEREKEGEEEKRKKTASNRAQRKWRRKKEKEDVLEDYGDMDLEY